MNIVNRLLQTIPSQFRSVVKRSLYVGLGTVLTLFYAQIVHAQSATGQAPVRSAYSPATITAALIGAVITIFFLRGMYLVLTYASETYGLDDEHDHDSSSQENNALLWGAVSWLLGSALIITSYGWGWGFLYLGPIICLLGPIVPIVAMQLDINAYKRFLDHRTAQQVIDGRRRA